MKMMFKIKIWLYIWFYKNKFGYTNLSVKLFFAQAIHETGNFTSKVFKESNNLFGMRHPSKRPTKSQGTHLNHGVFKNHRHSVIDYFQRAKYFKLDNSSDFEFMEQTQRTGYATDPNYIKRWRVWYDKVVSPISNKVMIAFFFCFILLIYIVYSQLKKRKK